VDILQNAKIMTCHSDSTLEQASSKAENLYSDFFFSSTRNSSTQLDSPQRVKTQKEEKKIHKKRRKKYTVCSGKLKPLTNFRR